MYHGENSCDNVLGWLSALLGLRYVILVVADYCARILGVDIDLDGPLQHILECSSEEACTLRRSCPFKDELNEAVRLYWLSNEMLTGVADECADLKAVTARVDELKAFAEMLKNLYRS